MKTAISSFVIGVVFAVGLGIAGMTQPQKVIGFLDIFGGWDPSLAFVMTGALAVHFVTYRLITKRRSPLFAEKFEIPTRRDIDKRLVTGAAIFGIGWGLAGYCPAPAITSLATLAPSAVIFVASMIAGMFVFRAVSKQS